MKRLADRLNHEYWPWWLIYLPVVPLYLWQALRMRRAAFFTNVNPAMDMGGFFGERKSAIYPLLPVGCYPSTVIIPAGTPPQQALGLAKEVGLEFPFIAKPDVGERGDGVRKVLDADQLIDVLAAKREDMLLQALAPGEHEFGLMFRRDPDTGRTTLLSITAKRFLTVTGDGERTVDELLRATYRGDRQRMRLRTYAAATLASVPRKGTIFQVEPVGNHCRGTTFLYGGHLCTPALENAVERLLSGTRGFHYGRFDVRSPSEQALRAGVFSVIELNGVSSEPGHIYDPSWSIWRCWGELVRHVRHIGGISEALLAQGAEPCSLHELVLRSEAHFGWRLGVLKQVTAWSAPRPAHRSPRAHRPPRGTAAAGVPAASAPPRACPVSPIGTAG